MKNNYRKSSAIEERKWWRTSLIFGLTFLIGLTTISCEKESTDEYYVKYELNSTTIYTGGKLDMIIKTEENKDLTLVINQRTLHETIIGPVGKGFNTSMSVLAQGNTHDKLKLYTNIYVGKNGGPFALKKTNGSDEPRDFVQLNYTIDY